MGFSPESIAELRHPIQYVAQKRTGDPQNWKYGAIFDFDNLARFAIYQNSDIDWDNYEDVEFKVAPQHLLNTNYAEETRRALEYVRGHQTSQAQIHVDQEEVQAQKRAEQRIANFHASQLREAMHNAAQWRIDAPRREKEYAAQLQMMRVKMQQRNDFIIRWGLQGMGEAEVDALMAQQAEEALAAEMSNVSLGPRSRADDECNDFENENRKKVRSVRSY